METPVQIPFAGASTASLVAVVTWAGALVAALIATMQRARATKEIGERVQELDRRTASLIAPVRHASGAPRATPRFGAAFYDVKPSPFEGLFDWPGAAPSLLAAALALAGGIMLLASTGNSDLRVHDRTQLLELQTAHDSLARLVLGLRDSMRIGSHAAVAPALTVPRSPDAVATGPKRRGAPARDTRTSVPAIPPATGILPAAPVLDLPVASPGASSP